MTIRIPKWLLAGMAAIAAVAVAFLVGERQGSAVEPTCSRAVAERAVVASNFDDTIREQAMAQAQLAGYSPTTIPFFTSVPTDYQVAWLRCRDVTGDGADEMIVGVGAGAARRTFQWAIFTPGGEGQWDLAFDREGSLVSSIRTKAGAVVAQTPTTEEKMRSAVPRDTNRLRSSSGTAASRFLPARFHRSERWC